MRATDPSTGNATDVFSVGGHLQVGNLNTRFREAAETYTPGEKWVADVGAGDLVYLDGNAAGASYLVISKDPLTAGTETTLTAKTRVRPSIEAVVGLSMSQRIVGQELSVELVDVGPALPQQPDLAIAAISQTTTTLTVDTVAPHGLSVGRAIGIRDCSNPLVNYPQLVVASVPSPTQFTCTSSATGALTSQTVTNPTGAKGFVYHRSRLGWARNGMSMIFESTTVTTAALYVRAESGDVLPSGTAVGPHSATVGSTASTQLAAAAAFTYAFGPTTEFRMVLQPDRAQWFDNTVDSHTVSPTLRFTRTQVVPDPSEEYTLRLRMTNVKGLMVPAAQIVSVSKSGTTTATIVCDRPHGFAVGDFLGAYGVRDATNFPNLAPAAVASVVNATTVTVVWSTAVTATSYGGFVYKSQANLTAAGQTVAQVVQSATLSTLADGTRRLVLVGSAAWAGVLVGDGVNVVGLRNATNGATLGLDGPWKVSDVSTTNLSLVPLVPGVLTLPADFGTTNCGGAIIKRTEARLSYARLFDYERNRVEMMHRSSVDVAGSLPTVLTATATVVPSSSSNFVGSQMIPAIVADVASAALTTTTTTAALSPTWGTSYQVNVPVTAVSGTTPTLDFSIEESDDTGVNWFRVYDFPRITATGMYRSPVLPLTGNRIRYVQTVGGTTPSFTRAVNRLQQTNIVPGLKQIIDRSIALTTLNSTTPTIQAHDVRDQWQMVFNVGAITTTAPAVQLEGSDDNGATWVPMGAPLTAVASSTVQLTVPASRYTLVRARVSTAGVGVTAGYLLIRGMN